MAEAHLASGQEQRRSADWATLRTPGDADWLAGASSAGNLAMVMVLRRADGMGIVEDFPTLAACIARGEALPACQRAFSAQRPVFDADAPSGGNA